jgi:hypothetical protein
MATITFTASIISKSKGRYIARAEELALAAEPATTQRGAIKKLKTLILARFQQAAEEGCLKAFLDDAGYAGILIHSSDLKNPIECHVFNTDTVLLPVPQSLARASKRNRMRKR